MHSCVHHHVMFICRLLVAVWTSQFVVDSSTLPYSFTSCSIPLFSPSYLLCRRLACGPPPLCYTYRRYDDLRKKEVDENQTMWTTVFAGWHIGQANRHTMNRDTHAALTDSFKSIRNVLVHLGACLDEWDPVLLGHLGTLFRCYFLRKSIVRKSFVWNIAFIRR